MTKSAALPYKIVLLIDSSERDKTNVALSIDGEVHKIAADSKAQELPSLIEKLLSEQKLLLANVNALALVKRPGSVTAIRIGTAIANTLAWIGHKHIIEIDASDIDQALAKLHVGKYESIVKISQPLS